MNSRLVGSHIRLVDSLTASAKKAQSLLLPIFQSFLIKQDANTGYIPTHEDIVGFKELRSSFSYMYLHGSYWINPASLFVKHHSLLFHELYWAELLGFTHYVLHPGSIPSSSKKILGIKALANVLNELYARKSSVTILLENGAHGAKSIGSDLQDFKLLIQELEQPDKFRVCIDTAHAYSYGYNIATHEGVEHFIELIDATVGIHRVDLIHLNDTTELLGSRIDKHAIIGQGNIGIDRLKQFAVHSKLLHIPIIMELPVISLDQEKEIVTVIQKWEK